MKGVLLLVFGIILGFTCDYVLRPPVDVEAVKAQMRQFQAKQIHAAVAQLDHKILAYQDQLSHLTQVSKAVASKYDIASVQYLSDPPEGGYSVPEKLASTPGSLLKDLETLQKSLATQTNHMVQLKHQIAARQHLYSTMVSGFPVAEGWISSPFGERLSPFTLKPEFHEGVDIAAQAGTPIMATGAGEVVFAGRDGGYGNLVEIRNGPHVETKFGHCEKIEVKRGQHVRKGQVIALLGDTGLSTGPHVHYEVVVNGHHVNPLAYLER